MLQNLTLIEKKAVIHSCFCLSLAIDCISTMTDDHVTTVMKLLSESANDAMADYSEEHINFLTNFIQQAWDENSVAFFASSSSIFNQKQTN